MKKTNKYEYSALTKSGIGTLSLLVVYKNGTTEERGTDKTYTPPRPCVKDPVRYISVFTDMDKIKRITVVQTNEVIYSVKTDKDDSLPF
jgi:hypothetical protein